jgi:lipopolysaccharide transport system permease protein
VSAAGLARNLLAYRGFIVGSVRREFQLRYRNSLLGAAWTILNPLVMIAVYTLVFSQLMKMRLPGVDSTLAYGVYLCAGIFAWNLFAETVGRLQNVFIENGNLIKKLVFPRICLPVIVVLNALVNFGIVFTLFLLVLVLMGAFPGPVVLAVIPVLAVQVLFATGLGVAAAVFNVFFRDVGHAVGIALQLWFWLTPIVYPIDVLGERARDLLALNPMTVIITAWQQVLVYHRIPDWQPLATLGLVSVLLCLLAWRLFRRHVAEMVDEL